MKSDIRDLSLNELLEMRFSILQEGRKMYFTTQEINAEFDRRNRLNTPMAVLADYSIYTP